MEHKNKVVLGAGIAGLGAYYADPEVEIYEALKEPGGLCNGFWVDKFYFDKAVHLSFSKNRTVRELFDKISQYIHAAQPYSWYRGQWLRHPAQNNLYPLPPEEKTAVIKSFLARKGREGVQNFAEWLIGGYGEYLFEKLFCVYNKKYWCTDLDGMGVEWIGNRIYQPTLEEVLVGTYTDRTPNTYYASQMYYPCAGGYFRYIKSLADSALSCGKLHFGKRAVKVIPEEKMICFSDGTEVIYKKLYSSIPLPEMVCIINDVPMDIKMKANELEHTGVILVSVGLLRCRWEKLWFYIYDNDIFASRAYMPSVKSLANVPDGCYSIQFEIYFNGKKGHAMKKEAAVSNCLYAIEKLGLASLGDVLFTDYRVVPYGNIIGLKQTERELPQIITWLNNIGIVPIGRFGKWEYLWSDQAFLSGYRAVGGNEE